MNQILLKFINYIHKPFEELNTRLSEQLAVQPEVNDVIKDAMNLAINLNHFCDWITVGKGTKKFRKQIHKESIDNKILSDVADMSKHSELTDKLRHNKLYSAAVFEFNDMDFCRYLRTIIWIVYDNGMQSDFIEVAAKAINYWINRQGYKIPRLDGPILAKSEYSNIAFLFYDPNKSLWMNSTRIETVRRDSNGKFINFDPYKINFAIYEKK